MTTSFMLEGKAILVTGAGDGIGAATARVLARHGAQLTLLDRNREAVQNVAKEIGGQAMTLGCDITDEAAVQAAIGEMVGRHGRIDGAFNNAGIPSPQRACLAELDADVFRRVVDVDLTGTFHCLKHEIAAMLRAGGGAIVNNASISARGGAPMMANYGAAKAGVVSLTQTAAQEYGEFGIRVNAVCPGFIDIPRIRAAMARYDVATMVRAPMQRMGTPEEVGELVAWLLSPLAGYVTGDTISVDGGQNIVRQ